MPDLQSVVVMKVTSKGPETLTLPDGSTLETTRMETSIQTDAGVDLPLCAHGLGERRRQGRPELGRDRA
ncbi:MAG: hypothetical protein R3E85_06180 [Planctomycetota bacterium]